MTVSTEKRGDWKSGAKFALPWICSGLCLTTLVIVLVRQDRREPAGHSTETTDARALPAVLAEGDATQASVSLNESKYRAAKIETEAAKMEPLTEEVGVVGRIEMNSDRRVEVRPRASGIVREVHVSVGQSVRRGTPLVTLDSPDIGTARLNLRDKQQGLATARFERDWRSQIAATVAQLIPEMQKGVDPSEIEKHFAGRSLGTYRGSLLEVYSEYDIAAHEESKTKSLRQENVVGEHPSLVARHKREGLQARLEATIEQVRFDAAQEKRLADRSVQRAEADVIDAAHRLRILGIAVDIKALLAETDRTGDGWLNDDVALYRIDAPFDGTIAVKSAVPSQKADLNDVLFVLADLKSVWINANVPESDVSRLTQSKEKTIHFAAASYPGKVFEGGLLSVGAMVDPRTRTLSLIAQADNRDGLLKPGMFVRVILDSPSSASSLTVPAGAVSEIEGKRYVFLPASSGSGEKKFLVREISTGREVGDRVAILAGLHAGDAVVARGAFILKSELILQNEADED